MSKFVKKYEVHRDGIRYEACMDPAYGDKSYITFWAYDKVTGHLYGYSRKLDSIMNRVRRKLNKRGK